MSFIARSATRIGQAAKQTTGHDVRKEMVTGALLGLALGLIWKSWQWNDKATRVNNNNKWDKQYPAYVAEKKAALLAAAAAEEEEPVAEEEAEAEVAAE